MILIIVAAIPLVIPGIYVAFRLVAVANVALFEPGANAFKRSWELTRDRALVVLVIVIGIAAIQTAYGAALGLLGILLPPAGAVDWGIRFAISLLGWTIPCVFLLVLYGGLRGETDASSFLGQPTINV